MQMTETERRMTNSFVISPPNFIMPTVLIVEDDTDNRLLLKIWLEMCNYCVIEAADGNEALNLAEESCPDLILMDVRMPLLDGLETTRVIRRSAKTGSVPIIFTSGCAEAKYREAATEAGANDYFVKPFDFDKLQSAIAGHITVNQIS